LIEGRTRVSAEPFVDLGVRQAHRRAPNPEDAALFAALLDVIDQCAVCLDEQGRITYANAAFAEVVGLSATAILDQPLYAFVAPRIREFFGAAWATLPQRFDIELRNADGRDALFTATRLHSGLDQAERFAFVLTAQDARILRARQIEITDALHATALDIVDQLDLTHVLQSLTHHAARLLRTSDVLTVLFDAERQVSLRVAALGRWQTQAEPVLPLKDGIVHEVWLTGVPVIVNGYSTWQGRRQLKRLDDVEAAVAAPIVCAGRTVGAIMLSRGLGEPLFSVDERILLERLTALASVAYSNARLYETARENEHALERNVAARTIELTQALEQVEQLRETAVTIARKQAAQDERARLARELHDSVSQSVFGIVLGVRTLQRLQTPGASGETASALAFIIELAESALTEMRALIFQLRPDALEQVGLIGALEKHLDAVRVRYKIVTVFEAEPGLRFDTATQEGLYRIAVEAVHNCVKHARARTIAMRVWSADGAICLRIQDDGGGFDAAQPSATGLGLISMTERATELGGSLDVASTPGHGTVITVSARGALSHDPGVT
jgi:signal transduction histidine kinase